MECGCKRHNFTSSIWSSLALFPPHNMCPQV
uniref:Uncharacterized protein n=1 Tax=Arundo donax TaxID=35708 RepID=A0A0A9SCG2_ARUDO